MSFGTFSTTCLTTMCIEEDQRRDLVFGRFVGEEDFISLQVTGADLEEGFAYADA